MYRVTQNSMIIATMMAAALSAQAVAISRSPVSASTAYLQSGASFDYPVVAFRFESDSSGDTTIKGFPLVPSGSTFADGVTVIQCWQDDGDGVFSSQSDLLLWSGAPALPVTLVSFSSELSIPAGTSTDVWIVLTFAPSAGSSIGSSYAVTLGSVNEVDASGATVMLGTPAPASDPVTLVTFELSNVIIFQGVLELAGSGFTPPFSLTVDGVTQHYSAPAKPPVTLGSQYGTGYTDAGYFLREDHAFLLFNLSTHQGWPKWDHQQMVSVQLVTASTGLHDLGLLTYRKEFPPSKGGGTSGGCSMAGGPQHTSLKALAALVLLAGLIRLVRRFGLRTSCVLEQSSCDS